MSRFYGIGVGPGDSSLLTLKAVEALKRLDVLVTPKGRKGGQSLALQVVEEHLASATEILERHFPMTADHGEMEEAWQQISAEIVAIVRQGKTVGFVTLGDPMLYSTYIYLLRRVSPQIPVTTIPGITSFQGIASSRNLPLVEGDETLAVVPSSRSRGELREVLVRHDSVVLMKVYRHFDKVLAVLEELSLTGSAIMVCDLGMPGEQVVHDLGAVDPANLSYFSTIIVNKGWAKS